MTEQKQGDKPAQPESTKNASQLLREAGIEDGTLDGNISGFVITGTNQPPADKSDS
jgi:hypothetical protein